MSYCRKEGKDKIIFVTEEDHEAPIEREDYPDDQEGLIREDGTINWECPCLGGMASGPCGVEFRESFTCFHYSTEELKGSDCVEQFRELQECMTKYPDYYTRRTREPAEEEEEEEDVGGGGDEDDNGQFVEKQSSKDAEDGTDSESGRTESIQDDDEGTAL